MNYKIKFPKKVSHCSKNKLIILIVKLKIAITFKIFKLMLKTSKLKLKNILNQNFIPLINFLIVNSNYLVLAEYLNILFYKINFYIMNN